jgi:hypothetical protein
MEDGMLLEVKTRSGNAALIDLRRIDVVEELKALQLGYPNDCVRVYLSSGQTIELHDPDGEICSHWSDLVARKKVN